MGNNSDHEEVERFKKALNLCRTCSHVMLAHSFMKPDKGRCIDSYVKVNGEYKKCQCKLFIPKDNLEFLEWAAENKTGETK